jgi:hypothetical protein
MTENATGPLATRRDFLHWGAGGLGATAFAHLLRADAGARPTPNIAPKVTRAINICLVGGLSQVDSFDYKPALEELDGKAPPAEVNSKKLFHRVGNLRTADWRFAQHGASGLWISDLFPHLAKLADELTVIRSMQGTTNLHTPALFLCNSGFPVNGFPTVGSWLSYGLGSPSDSLPAYVVIPDRRGDPSGGTSTWGHGFLPASHQGVQFRAEGAPIRDLFPPRPVSEKLAQDTQALHALIDQAHVNRLGGEDSVLEARLRSYQLAARMQLSVPEMSNISREPKNITRLYGLDREPTKDFARNCILARRMLERGVRFVQLFSGGPLGGKPRTSWDGHENMVPNHTREALRIDQPVAALLADLKQRGMLDDTLVTFTTEFGRTPFVEAKPGEAGSGRDHNSAGFTVWMAGAGLRPGIPYGETDEIGYRAERDVVTWHDFHATMLHLLGIDHTKLSYYHNGIERRLTNVHGEVVTGILA